MTKSKVRIATLVHLVVKLEKTTDKYYIFQVSDGVYKDKNKDTCRSELDCIWHKNLSFHRALKVCVTPGFKKTHLVHNLIHFIWVHLISDYDPFDWEPTQTSN